MLLDILLFKLAGITILFVFLKFFGTDVAIEAGVAEARNGTSILATDTAWGNAIPLCAVTRYWVLQ